MQGAKGRVSGLLKEPACPISGAYIHPTENILLAPLSHLKVENNSPGPTDEEEGRRGPYGHSDPILTLHVGSQ